MTIEAKARKAETNHLWYLANRERKRKNTCLWRAVAGNKERQVISSAAWRKKNKVAHNLSKLEWHKNNRAQSKAIDAKYRANKKQAELGDQALIAAVYHKAQTALRVRCPYCSKYPKIGERHVDHKVPLSKGGPHCADNLAICCGTCNIQKHDRTVEEYMLMRGKK